MGGLGVTLIAIGTFVVGLIVGGIGGVYFLKNKMMKMTMGDMDIASMAKSMGMNLNQKQMQQVQQRMKNFDPKMMNGMGGMGGKNNNGGKKRR
ncbi:MAG: YneF family protein [Tumebacillaceae bacterium]